ncbi:YciI family protein [Niveispirillum irakense]|uniref:YciI family protein n=1 Tax=Niveispirillum irakense TaxID=34011 RepID=UPI0003FE3491|nr:YciI family protein [Niveispirillum irakense]
MHIIFLRFTAEKARAGAFMAAHNAWLQHGFDDGIFLMSGGLAPGLGGVILAHGSSAAEIHARVAADPFVIEGIVTAEINEVTPGRLDERLNFLRAA